MRRFEVRRSHVPLRPSNRSQPDLSLMNRWPDGRRTPPSALAPAGAIPRRATKGTQGLADTRLKIAVFIDFDNIEIGVKSTLDTQFDIGVVLEALKERGEVVSKIAYGDWTRAGDYSRSLTQHATKLVQRNLTPGGDKNGADINLALDALEMAFTHTPHQRLRDRRRRQRLHHARRETEAVRQADLRGRRPRVHQPGDAAQLPRVHRLREPGRLAACAAIAAASSGPVSARRRRSIRWCRWCGARSRC